jgi:hypothetical protein
MMKTFHAADGLAYAGGRDKEVEAPAINAIVDRIDSARLDCVSRRAEPVKAARRMKTTRLQ